MIPRIFIKNPIKAISAILTRPLPNIIALGGVATGIIKAQDAERVAGIMRIRGLVFIAQATEARTGRIISVVAVFDVNSVKNVMLPHSKGIIISVGVSESHWNFSPIRIESPVA